MHAVALAAPAADLTRSARPSGLTDLGARELAALVRLGRVEAREVLAAHLDRLTVHAPALLDPRAGAAAARLDVRRRHGLPGGPLAGVPLLADPEAAVTCVLRSADALVLGVRCAAAEAAAAVAAGLLPLAVVAGSAAGPAAAHGLVGLDLAVAAELAGEQAGEQADSVECVEGVAGVEEAVGVLARDPRDAGLVLGAVRAAYDPAGLVLPAHLAGADRALAVSRLRTAAARVHPA